MHRSRRPGEPGTTSYADPHPRDGRRPRRAVHAIHLMPVLGAALAFVVIGESLQPFHLAGAAIIAAGILLAERRGRR